MRGDFDEAGNELEVNAIVDILVELEVKVVADIPYTVKVDEGVVRTSKITQRTRVIPTIV